MAAERVKSVGELNQTVAQAMNAFRDWARQAVWNVMADLLEHTGVDLPPNLPVDFTGLRSALGDIAGQLNDKNNRTFTRERSNQRRTDAIQACHRSADWLIKVDGWLGQTLAML